MSEEKDERQLLSFDEAVQMLPDGDRIHTFRNAGFTLIGADWPRGKLLDTIKQYGAELSGPGATGMGHGMVLFDDKGPLFIEVKGKL